MNSVRENILDSQSIRSCRIQKGWDRIFETGEDVHLPVFGFELGLP